MDYPLRFRAQVGDRQVSSEERSRILAELEKFGQKKILKILAESDEAVRSKIFSELHGFDFQAFRNYFDRFKSACNLISDVSQTKSIPPAATLIKSELPQQTINDVTELGYQAIARGEGGFTSRRHFLGRGRRQPSRLR